MAESLDLTNKIKLQKRRQVQGSANRENIISEKTVYAKVGGISLSFAARLQEMGLDAQRTAHLWRDEFEKDDYTHVVFGSKVYRIIQAGNSINENFVKLLLTENG